MSAPRQHRGGAPGRLAATLCAFLLLLAVFAQVSAARSQAACGGKPGSPNRGAVLQYCPSQVKKPIRSTDRTGNSGGTTTTEAAAVGTTSGGGGSSGPVEEKPGPEIPLTDYPSSGGVNALLFALLVAIAVAVAFGARRWRRGSAQAP
jgi:hypothetical protein